MARRAYGNLRLKFDITEDKTDQGGSPGLATLKHLLDVAIELAAGTADGQIDRAYSDVVALTTSATTFDVVGSTVLSELSGEAISLVDLVAVAVVNLSLTDGLIIGGSALNVPLFTGSSAGLIVPPGGANLWYGGLGGVQPVQATSDIIRLVAQANTPSCRFGFAGRSA